LQGPEKKIDLFHAALLVSRLDNPEVDVEAYRRQLEEMAREVAAKLPAQADDAVRLAALTKYLFVENGFHGSRTDYYNRANSYINEVLDDREGLPIALSVLFLELARRIGLEDVAGVPLPGHFVVKYAPAEGAEQLIDVFDGGQPLSREEAGEMVMRQTGAVLTEEHLKPATKRDIIVRMLRNLFAIAQFAESTAASLCYLDVIITLSPDSPIERLDRARLRLQSGDADGARKDLKWLLDHAPSGIDLEPITELYHSLKDNGSPRKDF
jgi:regulator of sirC expression with transglutaminase-like and TPR domain